MDPVAESDSRLATTVTLNKHSRYFAEHSRPEIVIPDIIADLRAHPSQWHFYTYLGVMQYWPRDRVLRILMPYRYTRDDPDTGRIATDFATALQKHM